MAAGSDADPAGIVALALSFHRAPTRHADLLHGPARLPAGIATLLKVAGGSEPDPGLLALATPEELKAAALFFVEQVLFRRDASHYRILGLEAGAAPEQLKEHHRLLMRAFHPDRENRADDWKDAFATRINLAYTALRDADERRRYDAALKPESPSGTSVAARPAIRPRVAPRDRTALPPAVRRHLPQWVLAASALVAVGAVGLVYLSNPQAPAPTRTALAPPAEVRTPAAEAAAPAAVLPARLAAAPATPMEEASAPAGNGAAPAAAAADVPAATDALPAKPAAAAPRAPRQAVVAPTPRAPVVAQQAESVPRPPAVSQPAPVATPLKIDDRLELAQTAAPAPTPEPRSAEPPQRTAALPERAAAPDPDATLARFVASYERGDTQALMALFDEVAIARAGGKPQIRREHESLFRATELRHMAIDRMNWTRDGDWIRGEGRYRATQMRKGEQWLRTESGVIRIELQQRGGEALIMGLDYQPRERS